MIFFLKSIYKYFLSFFCQTSNYFAGPRPVSASKRPVSATKRLGSATKRPASASAVPNLISSKLGGNNKQLGKPKITVSDYLSINSKCYHLA